MNTNRHQSISWDDSLKRLQEVLPGATSLSQYEIARAAREIGRDIPLTPIPDWEELEDLEIFRLLMGSEMIQGGRRGILVPDMCSWGKHLPFLVRPDRIKAFVSDFIGNYGEAFFNGDTVILLPSESAIYLLH